ncbi:MAG: DUF6288 domain-containing protein [Chthoniobacter sp.]|nr:DUF6288 domain-containing protein [Chthoniobacter sp.]
MTDSFHLRASCTALSLVLLFTLPAGVNAVTALKIDLTVDKNISKVDRTYTYNLGPTGMRGWIDNGWPETPSQDGYTAFAPYQILVTTVADKTPAAGIMAPDDIILGASAGAGVVPLFTGDARKSLGWAIGAAEGANGILKLKRWRAGVATDVSIALPVMGTYSDTAPYNCPKSSNIMANAAMSLQKKIVKNGWGGADGSGAISALALLATGNPDYLPMLQTYARSLAPKDLDLERNGVSAWNCYNSIFLAEYYMLTNDAEVFHGLSEYVIYAAKHTSMFGTSGHGFSTVAPPGGWQTGGTHGSISWYGPVNQAGLAAQLTIVLGKKAGVKNTEIDPAIARAANFFGYYVNRGSVPYGEHQPYYGEHQLQGQKRTYYDHCSNGKDGLAAVMFACMGDKTLPTEYFSRMALAGFKGEAYGHTGQGFSYLWTALGAAMGGPQAAAEYLKQMRWDRDMKRRCDGSFVYEGGEQWAPGRAKDYWDDSYTYWGNPTAYYLLHAALPLKKLCITGKLVAPANHLDSKAVSNSIWAAEFTARCGSYTKEQLVAALGEWDPIVRFNAATELSVRDDGPSLIPTLITMAENPSNANQREAACTALGCMKAADAVPALTRRLSDPDIWVRAKAAKALGQINAAAATAVPDMLGAFVKNVAPTYPFETGFNWSDPLQIANGYLAETLFHQLGGNTIKADRGLLYPAVRAGIKQPAGMWRNIVSSFVQDRLTLADVVALAPDLFADAQTEGPCDRMFTAGPVGAAMMALSKNKIDEGIDISLGNVTYWGQLGKSALGSLPGYGEAARRALPTLRTYLAAWPPGDNNAPIIINTIDAIEAATTAPALVNALPVASPQILVVPPNTPKAITLKGSSYRSDKVTWKITNQPSHGTITGSAPNLTYTPEKGYLGIDRFTFAVTDSLTTSPPATVNLVVGAGGTGLNGYYYDNKEFAAPKASQLDPDVNFDWGSAPPAKTLGAVPFYVRWTGQVLAPESGTYRFSTRTSDGVRLWINGVQVIDDWKDHTTKLWNDSPEITLTAGQRYSLKMEYCHNSSPASARLYWYMPSRKACSIVAQELLYPVTGVILTSPSNGASFGPPATVTLTADVADVPGNVTKVAFYNGETIIGTATTPPFSMEWKNVPAGSYRLTAKAAGGNGQVSTSTAAMITVDGNTVPVTSGLVCWLDPSFGIYKDPDQQVLIWNDRSGNAHHAVHKEHNLPTLVQNEIASKPVVRFTGDCRTLVSGKVFIKEQYLVVRSPSPTWSNAGSFIGRESGRASSYLLDGNGTTGFNENQFPAAISKNGSPIALEKSAKGGFSLGTITDFMILKITVNDQDTKPTRYLLSGTDGDHWLCKFDLAEILCYSRALTAAEEASVGGYLAAKYGIHTTYPKPPGISTMNPAMPPGK